ncbi:MBL fold metallo-hydrolase [Szabonella alba]|uniref:MBL fold metallo-hydrolase n=1 Tax=Szabonella alba TaxID=2804194 RepID=A0A8K0XZ44_9RHOB|nr:MBL fold metallo-hydrolase [Szabonella alba]MBL4916725.1 MBL fold metallo-hydrolase [Szabonella alba]
MIEQTIQAELVVDAAPAPVAALASFPGSDADGWGRIGLTGLTPALDFAPNLGCFLVRHRDRLVLCDTGIGPGPNIYLDGLRGSLLQRLAAIGVAPDQIDLVLFTHLHMDHIGWASQPGPGGGRIATFPKAHYIAAGDELDYWSSGAVSAKAHHHAAYAEILHPLVATGAVAGIAPGTDITPGLRFLAMPGHTPGHCAIRFDGGPQPLVIAGDVFHCPGQVERPDWSHRADMDPDRAHRTRQDFLEQAAAENWRIGAGHFRNGLAFGEIAAKGGGYRFVPQGNGRSATGW